MSPTSQLPFDKDVESKTQEPHYQNGPKVQHKKLL